MTNEEFLKDIKTAYELDSLLGRVLGWRIGYSENYIQFLGAGDIVVFDKWYRTFTHDVDLGSTEYKESEGHSFFKVLEVNPGKAKCTSDVLIGRGSKAYLRDKYPEIIVKSNDGKIMSLLEYAAVSESGYGGKRIHVRGVVTPEIHNSIVQSMMISPREGYRLWYAANHIKDVFAIQELMKAEDMRTAKVVKEQLEAKRMQLEYELNKEKYEKMAQEAQLAQAKAFNEAYNKVQSYFKD